MSEDPRNFQGILYPKLGQSLSGKLNASDEADTPDEVSSAHSMGPEGYKLDRDTYGLKHLLELEADVPTVHIPTMLDPVLSPIPITPVGVKAVISDPAAPMLPIPMTPVAKEAGKPSSNSPVSSLIRRILSKRLMGFSLVGGGVMVGGILFLFILVHFLHVEQHIAYLLQAIVSIESNFFLNRFLNWKERNGNLFAQWIKFHSTSAVTFPVNQALFAVLTGLGISYLIVTIIGAGVAAVINYIANDRFVFHKARAVDPETVRMRAIQPITTFPHIGVIIPVRNSQRTIRQCIESVLKQRYPGRVDIFIVGNSPQQDGTWQALGDLINHPAIHCIQITRPYNWSGRDANLKRYSGCKTAFAANVDVIALLDSQVTVSESWLLQAATLMHEYHIDGVAGRSSRPSGDHSFTNLYQDCSLFSEWPTFGGDFFLSKASFGKAKGLPITSNLLITRQVWERMHEHWPLQVTYSWEDFRLVWEIMCAGYTLFCTDAIRVFRNHKRKFRLAKQFAAGAGAISFYRDYTDCSYAKWRILKAYLVAAVALSLPMLLITAVVLQASFVLSLTGIGIGFAFLILGILSSIKARDLRGIIFPFIDAAHIGLWIIGAAYQARKKGDAQNDGAIADLLVKLR